MNKTALQDKTSPKKRKLRAQSLYNASEIKKFIATIDGEWDKYCFTCHSVGTHLFCKDCVRSYHLTCIKKKTQIINAERFTCEYCTESFRSRVFERKELSQTLEILMQHLFDDGEFQSIRTLFDSSAECEQSKQKIINRIDLDGINAKVKESKYHTLVAFLSDIYWLQHNYIVIGKGDSTKCRILRQLVSYCENELYDIDLCSECYRNANEYPDKWFTMVCEHPHILVWAKCDDDYWPAKAMATTTVLNATQIYVRYFGGHRRFAYIGSNDCYLYSTIHPKGLNFEEIDQIHKHATSEVNEYVKNIMRRFGFFRFAAERVLLKPHRAIYQLKTMIPDINLHNKSFNRFFNSAPFEMVSPFVLRADEMRNSCRPSTSSGENLNDSTLTTIDANLSQSEDFMGNSLIAPPHAFSSMINYAVGAEDDTIIDQHNEDIINILSDSDDESFDEAIPFKVDKVENSPLYQDNIQPCTSTQTTDAENLSNNSSDNFEVPNVLMNPDDSVPMDDNNPVEDQVPNSTTGPNSSIEHINDSNTSKNTQPSNDTSNENIENFETVNMANSFEPIHNSTQVLNDECHSLITMINANFKAYDQKITTRDDIIRQRDIEIETLKKKLYMAEKNLKSVVTCFKEAKSIHNVLVESCEIMEKERKIQQQAFEALCKNHEQKVAEAAKNHLNVFDKLANLLK